MFQWLATYATYELELDFPVVEALGVPWPHIHEDLKRAVLDFEQAPAESEKKLRLQHHRVAPEVVLALLSRDGLLLRYVPQADRTEAMYTTAVYNTGFAIQFAPTPSQALCIMAVRRSPEALKCININDRTHAVCRAALECNGLVLTHIPRALQLEYPDLCIIALRQNPDALYHVRSVTAQVHMAVAMGHLARAAAIIAPSPLRQDLLSTLEHIATLISPLPIDPPASH